jgi:hypothetical protein
MQWELVVGRPEHPAPALSHKPPPDCRGAGVVGVQRAVDTELYFTWVFPCIPCVILVLRPKMWFNYLLKLHLQVE